jgi:ABC-type multidrug transport system fused ATPase/permease subunit
MFELLHYFLDTLNPRRKRQWLALLALMFVTAVVELAALGLVALFITSLTSLDQVMLSRYADVGRSVFGEGLFADPKAFYLGLGAAAVALMIVKNAMLGAQQLAANHLEGAMNADAGALMIRRFLDCPYAWSSRQPSPDVHSYVQWRLFVGYLPSNLVQVLSDAAISLLLLGSLFVIEPQMSVAVLLVIGGAGAGVLLLCKRRISRLGKLARELNLANSREVLRNVQGLRELKAFNAAPRSLALLEGQLERWGRITAWQKTLERSPVWFLESVSVAGIIGGSVAMISYADLSNARIMGALSLVALSAWRILPSISRIVGTLGSVSGFLPHLRSVREFLEAMNGQLASSKAAAPRAMPVLREAIAIKGLGFRYPETDRMALEDLNISIARGEMIGVIGHSGSGKSTLADLLAGFLEPTAGGVLIDGRALDENTAESWREQLGIVSQSPFFFEGSLRENITLAFASAPVDEHRLASCCELAGVNEFLDTLPHGLDSSMGERGARLSGGQVQRVAIARALYRDPELLIFDEATSSLDEEKERLVLKTILGLKGSRTILIIAHRLSTVEHCDRIVWLNRGRMRACDSPGRILPSFLQSQAGDTNDIQDATEGQD